MEACNRDEAARCRRRARELAAQGNAGEAARFFRRAQRMDPSVSVEHELRELAAADSSASSAARQPAPGTDGAPGAQHTSPEPRPSSRPTSSVSTENIELLTFFGNDVAVERWAVRPIQVLVSAAIFLAVFRTLVGMSPYEAFRTAYAADATPQRSSGVPDNRGGSHFTFGFGVFPFVFSDASTGLILFLVYAVLLAAGRR